MAGTISVGWAVVIFIFSTPAVMDCLAANAVCGCSFCYPVSWQIHFKSISSRVAVLTEANPTQPSTPRPSISIEIDVNEMKCPLNLTRQRELQSVYILAIM